MISPYACAYMSVSVQHLNKTLHSSILLCHLYSLSTAVYCIYTVVLLRRFTGVTFEQHISAVTYSACLFYIFCLYMLLHFLLVYMLILYIRFEIGGTQYIH
jgi:hypothetical protein